MQNPTSRGFTLTEVTVVLVLAAIVMLGLTGFYMNSQTTWTEASAQALTQREATSLVEELTAMVHQAAFAHAESTATGFQLDLYKQDSSPLYSFWFDPSDSTVHEGPQRIEDNGASVTSRVERFAFVACGQCDSLVELTSLRLRSSSGHVVETSAAIALYNRGE